MAYGCRMDVGGEEGCFGRLTGVDARGVLVFGGGVGMSVLDE